MQCFRDGLASKAHRLLYHFKGLTHVLEVLDVALVRPPERGPREEDRGVGLPFWRHARARDDNLGCSEVVQALVSHRNRRKFRLRKYSINKNITAEQKLQRKKYFIFVYLSILGDIRLWVGPRTASKLFRSAETGFS